MIFIVNFFILFVTFCGCNSNHSTRIQIETHWHERLISLGPSAAELKASNELSIFLSRNENEEIKDKCGKFKALINKFEETKQSDDLELEMEVINLQDEIKYLILHEAASMRYK